MPSLQFGFSLHNCPWNCGWLCQSPGNFAFVINAYNSTFFFVCQTGYYFVREKLLQCSVTLRNWTEIAVNGLFYSPIYHAQHSVYDTCVISKGSIVISQGCMDGNVLGLNLIKNICGFFERILYKAKNLFVKRTMLSHKSCTGIAFIGRYFSEILFVQNKKRPLRHQLSLKPCR